LSEQATVTFETHLLSCSSCCEQLKLGNVPSAHPQRHPGTVPGAVPPLRPGLEEAVRPGGDPTVRPGATLGGPPQRTDYLKKAGELLQGTAWAEKADMQRERVDHVTPEPGEFNLDGERLLVLLQASQIMNSLLSLDAIVPRILGLVPRVLRAERSIVFLLDETGKLQPFAQADVEPQVLDEASQYSQTILQRTTEDMHILSSGNAMSDERFSAYESIQQFEIRSFMCVPIKSRGKVIGTLYVDNRNLADSFDQQDLSFLRILANQAGTAIENAQLHDRLQAENLEMSTELARLRQ
jgi:hypothetical protein